MIDNSEFVNEINYDLNQVKSLVEHLSSHVINITNKYAMTDENLYYVLLNCRKAAEHMYGSIAIAQNNGIENSIYLKNVPYQQSKTGMSSDGLTSYQQSKTGVSSDGLTSYQQSSHVNPRTNMTSEYQNINQPEDKYIKPIIFSRQRSTSNQSHLRDRWEDIEPTPMIDYSISVPIPGDTPMDIDEITPTQPSKTGMSNNDLITQPSKTNAKKAFADVVKEEASTEVQNNKTDKNQENLKENKNTTQDPKQEQRDYTKPKKSIKPFQKQTITNLWNLQTKPGMILDYIHNQINELQFEITNMDNLMNTKFYFRDPSEINMHGLWQYNKRYFLSEDGSVYVYTKKRELMPFKQNGKPINYVMA